MPITSNHIVAVIPTYNNAGTIADVVRRVAQQMEHIIVVADGPTDNTLEVLSRTGIAMTVVAYSKNRGKGYALRRGFEKAREMGFTHVLTIDSDGQHYPEDIPQLYRMHAIHPDAIIIGSRGLVQDNMPQKNTFANKFSNFWFAIQTGVRLPDTQTGYRIYPLRHLHGEWLMTRRYEAELALLVFSAWANVDIWPVPVRVYYPPKEERVSHFRPAYDFTRISILNTLLCVLAICYGLPRKWLWSFAYYLTFFFMVVLVIQPTFVYLRLRYGDSEKMHRGLHLLMQRCARWFLGSHPMLPFHIREVEGATPIDESKPCVLIGNHSSLLDTLGMMAVHTRITIMTKEWVTKNWLFGMIARSFDILPVRAGIDEMMPAIREKVEQGFSVCVFPEGTRSKTGEPGRFHRGAFYIAEELGLPIRPILFRGNSTALNKTHVYTGLPEELSINVLPEILPDDKSLGADYKERTHRIAQYYRDRMDCFEYPYQTAEKQDRTEK